MTLGAYYATQPLLAIHGLGDAPEQNMADVAQNALTALVASSQPLGTFVPWAGQLSDNDWQVVAPDTRYMLYPVSDTLLSAAEKAAFGQPVGFVVALSTHQISLANANKLFDGTPFEYFSSDAVYSASDTKPAPTIAFVYWGRLRPNAQTVGNYTTLQKQAQALGVQLAFPVYVPAPPGATQPAIDFNLALKAQQSPTATATMTPTSTAVPAAEPAAPVAAGSSGVGKVLIVLAVGGVAAYAGYRIVHARKRRTAAA